MASNAAALDVAPPGYDPEAPVALATAATLVRARLLALAPTAYDPEAPVVTRCPNCGRKVDEVAPPGYESPDARSRLPITTTEDPLELAPPGYEAPARYMVLGAGPGRSTHPDLEEAPPGFENREGRR
jgi:hypothetical protein